MNSTLVLRERENGPGFAFQLIDLAFCFARDRTDVLHKGEDGREGLAVDIRQDPRAADGVRRDGGALRLDEEDERGVQGEPVLVRMLWWRRYSLNLASSSILGEKLVTF